MSSMTYNAPPLSSFLFLSTFSIPENSPLKSNSEFTSESFLNNLRNSVLSVTLPKLHESVEDTIRLGFTTLNYTTFSVGKQDLEITFYEDEKMSLTKMAYTLLKDRRSRYSSLNDPEKADLAITITVWSSYGSSFENPLLQKTYYSTLINFVNPSFNLTGEVSLLQTKMTFRAIEVNISYTNCTDPYR